MATRTSAFMLCIIPVVLCLLFIGGAEAQEIESDTKTIEADWFEEISFETYGPAELRVEIDSDTPVDVLFMDYSQAQSYAGALAALGWLEPEQITYEDYDTNQSHFSVTDETIVIDLPEEGRYTVIIDNSGIPYGGAFDNLTATVTYKAEVVSNDDDGSGGGGLDPLVLLLLLIVIVVVIAAAAAAAAVAGKKKKAKAAAEEQARREAEERERERRERRKRKGEGGGRKKDKGGRKRGGSSKKPPEKKKEPVVDWDLDDDDDVEEF